MARSHLTLPVVALAALMAVDPATAQFGDLFRDFPPRPPGDVPSGRQQLPPPSRRFPDEPPDRPQPPPMSQPPSSRPGIQSQPLPPPPGSLSPQAPLPPPQQQQAAPGSTPGLPPGQRQPRGQPQPANIAPQPGDEVAVDAPTQKLPNPQAVFAGLDKVTGRIISFDVDINETVQFGALQVTPRVCYTRPPTETAQTDGFIDVDEVTLQGETRRIFTGWMFASSPGLHAVEHPIYDVWLTDCKGAQPAVAEAPATPAPQPASQQRQRQSGQGQQQGQPQQQRRVTPPPGTQQTPPPFFPSGR